MIRFLKTDELVKLLPLSAQVNALHEAEHPAQYRGDATADEVMGFFVERLKAGAVIFADVGAGETLRGILLAVPVVREASPFLHPARHVELDQICVDNNFRGRGIGKALVAAMEAWMAQTNFREWKSMVHGFNTHSQNLMLGQGAEVLGMRYHKTLG